MTLSRRFWFVLHPDVQRPIGGVKQIHRLVESLTSLGHHSTIIQDSASFHPGWFKSNVSTIGFNEWRLSTLSQLNPSIDRLVFPETFLSAIDSYAPHLPNIIFNQNGSYTFGLTLSSALSPRDTIDLYHSNSISHTICVSEYDRQFLVHGLGLDENSVSRISNSLETDLFNASCSKKRQICFMPRKNPQDAKIVISMLQQSPNFEGWSFKSIIGKSQIEVAHIMQDSLFFLSFGHPEGFGLPVAEAMACGCAVVGYAGLGGRELFDIGESFQTVHRCEFGDWLGFLSGMNSLRVLLSSSPQDFLDKLQCCSDAIRSKYNSSTMNASVKEAFIKIENQL